MYYFVINYFQGASLFEWWNNLCLFTFRSQSWAVYAWGGYKSGWIVCSRRLRGFESRRWILNCHGWWYFRRTFHELLLAAAILKYIKWSILNSPNYYTFGVCFLISWELLNVELLRGDCILLAIFRLRLDSVSESIAAPC